MNWIRFWPILLTVALAIFVFITKEHIWKKIIAILIPVVILLIKYLSSNITIEILCTYGLIIYFILLLIYYRNKGVV
ncbi:MAG: hypothetical protein K9N09_03400 [Candidatus Cloacimonetes bacterium]|nr:hypothetical protein [Candidatus Cloacimonadota bacterium]MCF7813430.1 hypothetical protein [Candidatus Cloacimonadota bacterium]MCF7867723.1 hypothetical protein [Candidatus Cloacimonadota bacterium]MCF7883191.1 hypothetical protein [Candidatus Cloacimonadota bacterium]